MRHYQHLYDQERKVSQELKIERTNTTQGRGEMEQLFLECVEEVKRDVSKRRDSQQIGALYQTKSSQGLINVKTVKDRYEERTPPPKRRNILQPKDKQRVIELLLENDKVLFFLYEKLFPQTSMMSNYSPIMARAEDIHNRPISNQTMSHGGLSNIATNISAQYALGDKNPFRQTFVSGSRLNMS